MKGMDAYIAIRGNENTAELSDVPSEKLNLYYKMTRPTLDYRVNRTKWVILRYPNPSMAQLANMSQESFEEFFFNVCTLDYKKMSRAMDSLVELMNRTDKVHLVGPDTDLTFSIKDIPAVKCDGRSQHPGRRGLHSPGPRVDERCDLLQYLRAKSRATPTKTSALKSKRAKSSRRLPTNDESINALLDTDEGARYFGEFAIGVNPYVLHSYEGHSFRRENLRKLPPDAGHVLRRCTQTATSLRFTGIW